MATTTVGTRRTELAELLTMIREGWEYCASINEEPVVSKAYHDKIEAEYNFLVAQGAPVGTETLGAPDARPLHLRKVAGSKAGNQYGTFEVAYATVKQVRYIQFLLESRDLGGIKNVDVNEMRLLVASAKVNKRAASNFIDALLLQPVLAAAAPNVRMASEKQVALITKLASEKNWFDEGAHPSTVGESHGGWYVWRTLEGDPLEMRNASSAIDFLFGCSRSVAPATQGFGRDDAGIYVLADGTLVRVYFGQNSGQMLCKKVVGSGLEYLGKADRFVVGAFRKATREEVGAWGKTTGSCLHCGRALDDPTSVDRGIGPICWEKF
jgi:hypothetical protein